MTWPVYNALPIFLLTRWEQKRETFNLRDFSSVNIFLSRPFRFSVQRKRRQFLFSYLWIFFFLYFRLDLEHPIFLLRALSLFKFLCCAKNNQHKSYLCQFYCTTLPRWPHFKFKLILPRLFEGSTSSCDDTGFTKKKGFPEKFCIEEVNLELFFNPMI